jgi:DNA-binding response OmpR family regulator
VLSRDALLEEAAGRGDVDRVGADRGRSHLSRMRQKLGEERQGQRLLKTVRGIGYVLAKDEV